MNGRQSLVLLLGLSLIVVRAMTSGQWSTIWGTVSKVTGSGNTATGSATHSSSENGATGSIPV